MSKEKTIFISAVVVVVLLAGYLFVFGNNTRTHDLMHGDAEEKDEMMDHAGHDMENLSEREFILHMIPHHQEAVDTAKEVLARGGTLPQITELALKIIETQEKEITDMKRWYEEWYGEVYKADGSYQPMMRDLSTLSGKELDQAFLEDMIEHHMMALTMTNEKAALLQRPELLTLAQNIAASQSEEVVEMRILLRQL